MGVLAAAAAAADIRAPAVPAAWSSVRVGGERVHGRGVFRLKEASKR